MVEGSDSLTWEMEWHIRECHGGEMNENRHRAFVSFSGDMKLNIAMLRKRRSSSRWCLVCLHIMSIRQISNTETILDLYSHTCNKFAHVWGLLERVKITESINTSKHSNYYKNHFSDITKFWTLPVKCIFLFRMIPIWNAYHFPIRYYLTVLCDLKVRFCSIGSEFLSII